MEKDGFKNGKIMTHFVASYWTVVIEYETSKLNSFADKARTKTADPQVAEIFKGYMDYVPEGKREVFLLE